jgi:CDGSH-type Zn-finger protein
MLMKKVLNLVSKNSNAKSLKTINPICSFQYNISKFKFSENKDDQRQTINISTENLKEETIDISKSQEVEPERVINISDVYTIKDRKMAPRNINNFIDKSRFEHNNVKLRNFNKEEYFNSHLDKKPIPISPRLGPFEIFDPKMEGKTYHWCSCGMSRKQPFCDGSHRNSSFRPISFILGEKVETMLLCGCKLSKQAPFCDGKTCVTLKAEEDAEINKKIQEDSNNSLNSTANK